MCVSILKHYTPDMLIWLFNFKSFLLNHTIDLFFYFGNFFGFLKIYQFLVAFSKFLEL